MSSSKVFIAAHVDQELFDKIKHAADYLQMPRAALIRYLLKKALSETVVLSIQTEPPPSD